MLWNKYWISSLSNSALFTNKDYFTEGICDLCKKVFFFGGFLDLFVDRRRKFLRVKKEIEWLLFRI